MSAKKKEKVIPNKLNPEIFGVLKEVVGERWISQQRTVIETYSKFSIDGQSFLRKYAKDPHALPACIILPSTTEEIQAIVRICNKYDVPFLPFTNGQVFCSVTSPAPTLCIHISRMNKVLDVDEETIAFLEFVQASGTFTIEDADGNVLSGALVSPFGDARGPLRLDGGVKLNGTILGAKGFYLK